MTIRVTLRRALLAAVLVAGCLPGTLRAADSPPSLRNVSSAPFRPVSTLCGYPWCPTSHTS